MEKVPSTHRFHVAKVEFVEENKQNSESTRPTEDALSNGSASAADHAVAEPDATSITFSLPNDSYGANQNSYTAYGTHLKTFGKNTTEAIPHVDHYRNLLSATSPLKTRPTLAELHEEKVSENMFLVGTEITILKAVYFPKVVFHFFNSFSDGLSSLFFFIIC